MTKTKPTNAVKFADLGTKIEPNATYQNSGFSVGNNLPAQWLNFLFYTEGEWQQWFDERFFDGTTNEDLTIKTPSLTGDLRLESTANRFVTLESTESYFQHKTGEYLKFENTAISLRLDNDQELKFDPTETVLKRDDTQRLLMNNTQSNFYLDDTQKLLMTGDTGEASLYFASDAFLKLAPTTTELVSGFGPALQFGVGGTPIYLGLGSEAYLSMNGDGSAIFQADFTSSIQLLNAGSGENSYIRLDGPSPLNLESQYTTLTSEGPIWIEASKALSTENPTVERTFTSIAEGGLSNLPTVAIPPNKLVKFDSTQPSGSQIHLPRFELTTTGGDWFGVSKSELPGYTDGLIGFGSVIHTGFADVEVSGSISVGQKLIVGASGQVRAYSAGLWNHGQGVGFAIREIDPGPPAIWRIFLSRF